MTIWHRPLTLDALNQQYPDTASHHVGIEYVEFGPEHLTARMPVNEKTRQPYGILHGGASCLLAETVGSHASALCIDPESEYCVGLEINANHIRPATRAMCMRPRAPSIWVDPPTSGTSASRTTPTSWSVSPVSP